jgi:DNA-binding transcriptional MerR regulator
MSTLERVTQLKEQGISEPQIIQALRQEGLTPKEISEALSQSKIKSVVDGGNSYQPQQATYAQGDETMEKSIMSEESPKGYNTNNSEQTYVDYPPQDQDQDSEQQTNSAPMPTQDYTPQYEENQYPEYQPQQPIDIETISEVIEQSIEEKNEPLKKQISTFIRFKEDISLEMEKINLRLTKIENVFSDLQTAILRKIGNYGEDIHTIAKEMRTTQDTFSKIIDPLTDNIRELKEITESMKPEQNIGQEQNTGQEEEPRLKKTKSDFESFLR